MGKTTSRNTNGLIRDYFPKGTDFNLVSKLKEVKIKSMKGLTNT
jgi:IS30 family transposase